jgi:hypothetical protein
MTTIRENSLNPSLDISGSTEQLSNGDLLEESLQLGFPIDGQNGSLLLITNIDNFFITVTGLSDMTSNSVGRFITIDNADTTSNNGTFIIKEFISSSSVIYENDNASLIEANNGFISWTERNPYTLQDDLNYNRTDRSLIKGVSYDENVLPYQRPDAVRTDVFTNLTNISGKTLDAKYQIIDKKLTNVLISVGNTFVTVTDSGNFPHATSNNLTGVPLFDTTPYLLNYGSCYVEIINPLRESSLEVLNDSSKRIFGITRDGSSISPDSIEIEFRQVTKGEDLSTSSIYMWESGQPNIVNMYYGFSVRSDLLDPAANRLVFINGLVSSSNEANFARLILETNGTLVYIDDGDVVLKT